MRARSLRDVGQLEVDHLRELVDVRPRAAMSVATSTCSLASLKSASARVRRLALVAVDRRGRDVVLAGYSASLLAPCLVCGEHQHLEPLVLLDQEGQQRACFCGHRCTDW
jgi:hypothetical protein